METSRKLNKFMISSKNIDSPKSNLSNTNIWKEHNLRIHTKSKHKKEKTDLKNMKFQSTRKFSKSPKIVLKLSKSEEFNLSKLKRFHWSKTISPSNKEKSGETSHRIMNKTVSPSKKEKSKIPYYYTNKKISPSNKRKSTNLYNTDIAAFIRENTIKDSLLLKNPVVVLQRLPKEIPCTSSPNSKSNFKRNNYNTSNTQEEIALAISDEQDNGVNKNETYELAEPETPNLRKILRDRQKTKYEESNLNEKVRKTSFRESMNCTHKSVLRSTPEMKELTKKCNHAMVVLNRIKDISSTTSAFERKSDSVTNKNIPVIKSLTPTSRLHGDSKIKRTPFTPATKKLGLKISVRKNVPHFAEIHKKLFDELESAVDAQQRLKERHRALTTPKAKNLPISNITPKNNFLKYNSTKSRIPYKTRLKDATNCIQKKEPKVEIISKRQRQNREILKGVRTNRRFELQMKSRNIKL
ncbi:uncharacterized protein LOC117224937 isoform X1 [Megalopta genalis]|uniref:uncharacterized protein LOC117224937 isoform X1 n=1 Tax=Megalopta genalis TaxID=115081 RepID=UPI003FD2C583